MIEIKKILVFCGMLTNFVMVYSSSSEMSERRINVQCDIYGNPTEESIKRVVIDELFLERPELFGSLEKEAKYLQRKGKLLTDLVVETPETTGTNSQKIYSVRINNEPKNDPNKNIVFLKISTRGGSAQRLIDAQQGFMRKLNNAKYADTKRKIPQKDLPIITWVEQVYTYKNSSTDQDNFIEVTHAAQGKSISEISRTDIGSLPEAAQALGRALGSFQQAFMVYEDPNSPETWTTAGHMDLNGENAFFDKKTSRIYFIDNESMEADTSIFFDVLSCATRPPSVHGYDGLTEVEIVKLMRVFQYSLIKGYVDSFPRAQHKQALANVLLKATGPTGESLWDPRLNCYLETTLCANADKNVQRENEFTTLDVAVAQGSVRKVKSLLRKEETSSDTVHKALLVAVKSNNKDMVQLLCDHGASVNFDSKSSEKSLLHYATEMGDTGLVKILLDNGARVHAVSANKTPLQLATELGHESAVRLLSEHIQELSVARQEKERLQHQLQQEHRDAFVRA